MRIVWLQHVEFEGLGLMAGALEGHELGRCRVFAGEALPPVSTVEGLVVMGGPMSVHEHRRHPWLKAEKEFIAAVVGAGRPVLGVCLGAQLLADVLGGKVFENDVKEIGWWPVRFDTSGPKVSALALPGTATVFHWHGDTFSLPPGAERFASSDGCVNQAFVHGGCSVGLQFHIEIDRDGIEALIENCGHE